MTDMRNDLPDIESDAGDDSDKDAIISADDTGMIGDERLILAGEMARADEESAEKPSQP